MRNLLTDTTDVKQHALASVSLTIVVLLATTVFPRLMVIGGLPTTDEGFYAFQSQLIHANLAAGRGLPDAGTLMIYPLLLSWVFEFSVNHMILLRMADLFIAVAASWVLYRVIARESGSRTGGILISVVFLFTMNQPAFVQCGLKNSIFAAFVPLFLALRIGQHAASDARVAWGFAGALAATAVLLRETFLPFLIIGALAIVMAHGWRACLRFTLGAAVAGLLVTLGIVVARGGVATLIESYRDAGVVYASLADQRVKYFVTSGSLSAKEAAVALIFGGLGIIATVNGFFTSNHTATPRRFAFWLSITLAPLLEPVSKIGLPYHFAVCLPGLAGLAAVGWKSVANGRNASIGLRLAAIAAAIGVLILVPKVIALTNSWPATRNALQSAGTGTWPRDAVVQSNYLLAAETIRRVATPNSTLSVSGFMYALYPLTGLLPPSNDLSNLSATLIKLDLDGMRFRQALLACPPDLLMTTTRTDWPGADTLAKAVADTGSYEQVATIPVSLDKSYGSFGGTVYRRIDQSHSRCSNK